eukprot:429573-Pelagomonas_calceolata.AAC.8
MEWRISSAGWHAIQLVQLSKCEHVGICSYSSQIAQANPEKGSRQGDIGPHGVIDASSSITKNNDVQGHLVIIDWVSYAMQIDWCA